MRFIYVTAVDQTKEITFNLDLVCQPGKVGIYDKHVINDNTPLPALSYMKT